MKLRLNGQSLEVPVGSTLLQATRLAGVEVPTLCHDDRLKPAGACRLCLVQVNGVHHFVPACATVVADGMEVETHTAEIEETRRTLLKLLAAEYPAEAVERWPEKQFHRWLKHYRIHNDECRMTNGEAADTGHSAFDIRHSSFRDSGHPYLAADFSKCITCFRCVRICDEVQGQSSGTSPGRGTTRASCPMVRRCSPVRA